jgi:hypothetical protein
MPRKHEGGMTLKHYGKPYSKTVVTKQYHDIEFITCDKCKKRILPNGRIGKDSQYVEVHTWHNDWGNDSCESHEYKELCRECAAKYVNEYVAKISGSEELELENCYLTKETEEVEKGWWEE